MGSIITLGIGRLELDWGKNWAYRNHSKLFLPDDKKMVPYYYVDYETREPIVQRKPGFARRLRSVKCRLELLGYALPGIRSAYDEESAQAPDFYEGPDIGFDLFARAVIAVDIDNVHPNEGKDDYDLGEYVTHNIFQDPEFNKTEVSLNSLSKWDGEFFENLDPYITLRLLAENPNNLEREVVWGYADVVEGGWVSEEDLYTGLDQEDKYLIVTEGSTDTAVLRKSLQLVTTDIADFFEFVDMSENYPFTGTGNLYRFCQGLARIGIQNKVVVLFDNDTAGCEMYDRAREIDLPPNMKVTKLPDLRCCRNFATCGPTGQSYEDINGKAVSIELFLDLDREISQSPLVRWTAYNSRMDRYQGALVDKEEYIREFLGAEGTCSGYDTSKLGILWEHLYETCIG